MNESSDQNLDDPSKKTDVEQPIYKVFTGDNIEVGIQNVARSLKMGMASGNDTGRGK